MLFALFFRPWKIIWTMHPLTLDDDQPIHALPVLDQCWKFERIWASTSIPIYVQWILAFASQRNSSSLFVIYIGRTCLNWGCREWYLMIFENTLVHKQHLHPILLCIIVDLSINLSILMIDISCHTRNGLNTTSKYFCLT